jgi:exopolysaccharide biosynthesis polyprenyl glycosylphosphotransferase
LGLLVLILLFRDGQYSSSRRLSLFADTFSIVRCLLVAYLVVMGASYATKGFFTDYASQSRFVIFANLLLMFVLMFAARVGMRSYQLRLFSRGESIRHVLIVGHGEAAAAFATFLEQRPWLGVSCTGVLSLGPHGDDSLRTEKGTLIRFLGRLEDAERLMREQGADEVIIALDSGDQHLLPEVARTLRAGGLPFRIVPSLFEYSYRNTKIGGLAEIPTIELAVDPLDRVQRTFKRTLDIVVSLLALILLSPILLTVAALIKLTSRGPIIFSQVRVGRNGEPFHLHKFRTMYQDAEERLHDLLAQNEAEGHIFKMKNDPRVTPLGRFLRKTSLDEFPQFFNVLFGEMSVVGPRPPVPREVECYDPEHLCRLKGRPGITGLWQVSGRSELTFDEMVRLDRYYLENWSLAMDLQIMLKTFYVVCACKGAY